MRVIGIIAALLVGLLALGGLLLNEAASNARASAWLARQAATLAPGELTLSEIDGDLASGLQIGALEYQLPGVALQATDVTISLAWPALLQRRLVLPQTTADRLTIELLPTQSDEDDDELPVVELPLTIRADELRVNTLRFKAAAIDETLTNASGRATWTGTQLNIAHLQAQRGAAAARLQGTLRFIDRYPFEARVEWREAELDVSGQGIVGGDLDRIEFAQQLRIPDAIAVDGVLTNVFDTPTLEATARWETLDLARLTDGLRADPGQLALSGWLDGYTVSARTSLMTATQLTASVVVSGNGDLNELAIDELLVSVLNGSIEGTGNWRYNTREVAFALRAANLDPALLRSDLPGRLGGDVRISGIVPDRITVSVERIDGTLLRQPVNARALLTIRPGALSVADLRAAIGDNRLEFDGTVTPSLTGRFAIDAPDLATFWPDAAGRLEGAGNVGGTLARPTGDVVLSGAGLSLGNRHVDAAEIRARIDDRQQAEIRVFAAGLQDGTIRLGDLGASLIGTLADHEVAANLTGGIVDVELRSRGSWNGRLLEQRLESGALDTGPGGAWRNEAPFAVTFGDARLRVAAHCWLQAEGGRLCLDDSTLAPGANVVSGELTALPLAIAQPWLADALTISGQANATFRLRQDETGLAASVDWNQQDTALVYAPPGDDPLTTQFEEATFTLRADALRTTLTGRLRSDLGIAADLNASLPTPPAETGPIDGQLIVDAPDIGTAAALIARFADIRKLRGRVAANLSLGGSLEAPRIRGEARLSEGLAELPQTGIEITDIEVTLQGNDAEPLRLQGQARSGEGLLEASGTAQFSRTDGFTYDIRVTGDRFEAVRLPGQTVSISPDVRARSAGKALRIDGSILIPAADIVVETLPESAATPSADAVVVGAQTEAGEQAPALQFIGELEVKLGENVHFAGFGLDTQLAGGLKLARKKDSVGMTAEGNLRTVEGRFAAYGKRLTIDRGTLIFNGPIDKPNVDVRASRKLTWEGEPVVVGVLLSGPITGIRTTLFSEPSMSEADALSFLVLNRPIQEAGDSQDLSNAAIALGISQALPITQDLQDSLGLDEVTLEGNEADTTALVAGKRISEDIYLRFSYGLFNRIGTFIVRYELGRGFSIEAGSGEEQTLDLIYSIRR